jgi:hypothetical protein
MLKPVPVTTAWLILTGVAPTFVTLATCELDVPTLAPTDRLLGVSDSDGSGSATPAHPDIQIIPNNTQIKSTRTWCFVRTFISIVLPCTPKFKFLNAVVTYPHEARWVGRQAALILGSGFRLANWRMVQIRTGGLTLRRSSSSTGTIPGLLLYRRTSPSFLNGSNSYAALRAAYKVEMRRFANLGVCEKLPFRIALLPTEEEPARMVNFHGSGA